MSKLCLSNGVSVFIVTFNLKKLCAFTFRWSFLFTLKIHREADIRSDIQPHQGHLTSKLNFKTVPVLPSRSWPFSYITELRNWIEAPVSPKPWVRIRPMSYFFSLNLSIYFVSYPEQFRFRIFCIVDILLPVKYVVSMHVMYHVWSTFNTSDQNSW